MSLVGVCFYNKPGQPEVTLGPSAPPTSWRFELPAEVCFLSLLPAMLSFQSYWRGEGNIETASGHGETPPGGSPLPFLIPAPWTKPPLQQRHCNPSLGLELADVTDCNDFLHLKQASHAIGVPGRKVRGKKRN